MVVSCRTSAALVLGNPQGRLTLVEFVDVACPHCQALLRQNEILLREHDDLRIVIKLVPALGIEAWTIDTLVEASRYQGKFQNFQQQLISHENVSSLGEILQIAKQSGLNVRQLTRDAYNAAVIAKLKHHLAELQALQSQGVPFLLLGLTKAPLPHFQVQGEMSINELNQLLIQLKQNPRGNDVSTLAKTVQHTHTSPQPREEAHSDHHPGL